MRTTYFNSFSAVSVLLLTMACTNVPARAVVNITAAQVGDTNEFIVSFDATSETNLIRAFALDIRLDKDANIVSVTGISSDYYIYPGTIQIDAQGNVIDFGTALAEYSDLPSDTLLGLDSNGVTIEMASLYAPVGPGSPNAPAKSGGLLSIRVNGCGYFGPYPTYANDADVSESCCVIISGNVARAGSTGVVMEDPNEIVEVNYHSFCFPPPQPPCNPYTCIKYTAPEYMQWEAWGKPECWCYARQCRGDVDGIKSGPFWVAVPDLNMFRAAFNKLDAALALVPNGICSDFDHVKSGPFRVAVPDLNIFRLYFNKLELQVPECDKKDYNCWLTP